MTFQLEMQEEDYSTAPTEWTGYFVLDHDHKPVFAQKAEWEAFQAAGKDVIADTDLGDGWNVLTFFDGNQSDITDPEDDPPMFFFTVVKLGPADGTQQFWENWADAKEGHDASVKRYGGTV